MAAEQKQQSIVIKVQDTGEGIPNDQLDKIYDPFYTTKDNGSGLGLAVVYRIINEHHGQIQVESSLNQGTSFKISLPLS